MRIKVRNSWRSYGWCIVPFALNWYRTVTTKTQLYTRNFDITLLNFTIHISYRKLKWRT